MQNGWGSVSDPRFLPAMIIMGVAVLIALAVFLPMWIKSGKSSDQMKALAQAQGWTWADAAPEELRETLRRLYFQRGWNPSKVMVVKRPNGNAYLFHFKSKWGSGTKSSPIFGIACLLPGEAGPNAPTYTINQIPSIAVTLFATKSGPADGVGSPAFRERYFVDSDRLTGESGKEPSELDAVAIPPALEKELLSWGGQRADGLPDGWSSATIRDRIVMVNWNSRDDISAAAWHALLNKAEKIRRALGER